MKYALLLILGLFSVGQVFATDYTVSSTSQIPTGYSLDTTSGWYTNSTDSTNRYRISSSINSSAGSAGSRSDSTVVNTSDSTNIFNGTISDQNLKAGNISMSDIPRALAGMVEFLMAIAGTISVFALIYYAVQMQINSGITGDSSGVDKAKTGMKGALIGFVVSMFAWFIVARVIEILNVSTSNY